MEDIAATASFKEYSNGFFVINFLLGMDARSTENGYRPQPIMLNYFTYYAFEQCSKF